MGLKLFLHLFNALSTSLIFNRVLDVNSKPTKREELSELNRAYKRDRVKINKKKKKTEKKAD